MLGRLLRLAQQLLPSFLPMTKNDDLLKKHTLPRACFSRIVLTSVPKGGAGLLGLIRTFSIEALDFSVRYTDLPHISMESNCFVPAVFCCIFINGETSTC